MKFILLIFFVAIISSCSEQVANNKTESIDKDSLRLVLMNIDSKWSLTSLEKGYHKSRLDFAADNAIDLLDKEMPLIGKDEIIKYTATHPDSSFSIQWNPLRAEVAASGDLGCTFGGWMMKTKTEKGKDTTMYGDYITVWQKQSDGSWKYIMDGGTATPEEVK